MTSSLVQELLEIELDLLRISKGRSDITELVVRLHGSIYKHQSGVTVEDNRFMSSILVTDNQDYPGDSIPKPWITKEYLDLELDDIQEQIKKKLFIA